MRNFNGLIYIADRGLVKVAGEGVLPEAKSIGGIVGQSALYAMPIVGSALTIGDGIKQMRNGHFWRGIGNIGLGLGTGLMDVFTGGIGGTIARSGKAALAAGKGASTAAKLYKAQRGFRKARLGAQQISNGIRGTGKLGKATVGALNFAGASVGLSPAKTMGGRMLERGLFNENTMNSVMNKVMPEGGAGGGYAGGMQPQNQLVRPIYTPIPRYGSSNPNDMFNNSYYNGTYRY